MKKMIVNLVTISVIMWTGCKKIDTSTSSADATAFTTGMQNLISTYQPKIYTVTVSADNGGEIVGQSSRFAFNPGAFITSTGAPVTGNVQVTYQEFSKKGQMILGNKTTMGTEGLLQSSGEVYINVTQNGNQLQVKPYNSVIFFHGSSFTQPMTYYNGTTSGSLSNITWQRGGPDTVTLASYIAAQCSCQTTTLDTAVFVSQYDTLYSFNNPKLGWINCDYFYSYPNITPVTITTPADFTNANTAVYLVFNTINMAASVYGTGNTFNIGGTYDVPVGMTATIVALGVHNGQWYSCFKPITITANDVESITMTPTTLTAYANAVMAL